MPEGERTYQVTAIALNVRESPSITARAIGFLHKDDVVDYISTSGDGYWLKITNESLEGWASHKYLTQVQDFEEGEEDKFPWLAIATAERGIKEFPGNGDNPRIVEYLQSTSLDAPYNANDEAPWCSAFVNWCVERSGYEGTDSAWARSWLNWGKETSRPVRGCIVVFKRELQSGHVGFYIGKTGSKISVLGGNQSDEVNESKYPASTLLGYRLPG
ncbi:MAG: TIGR02594 family protein [Nitrospira sp.]|jgi:uncharacterized protein (TIGR02594 family)|nr:TIGR02594 family protein [Nitrospira sp.]